jgi:hypothetical protein
VKLIGRWGDGSLSEMVIYEKDGGGTIYIQSCFIT